MKTAILFVVVWFRWFVCWSAYLVFVGLYLNLTLDKEKIMSSFCKAAYEYVSLIFISLFIVI